MEGSVSHPHQPESAPLDTSSSTTPFSCNVCKKNYTRIDHLARHFRSHSRERPYECQTCTKTFARIDLLKRHEDNHELTAQTASNRTPKRRKATVVAHPPRAVQACLTCAESKVRCDGKLPCARCQDKNTVCKFPEPCRDSADPKPLHTAELPQTASTNITTLPTSSVPESTLDILMNQVPSSLDLGIGSVSSSAARNVAEQPLITSLYEQDMREEFEMLKEVDAFGTTGGDRTALPFTDLKDVLDDRSLPRDVLDFGVDLTFDTPSIFNTDYLFSGVPMIMQQDQDLLEDDAMLNWSGTTTPGLRGKINILASIKAFKESLWLWTPQADDRSGAEQQNLFLLSDNGLANDTLRHDLPLLRQETSNTTRGKILAEVLKSCEETIHGLVISNFPSATLLTKLIYNFIDSHLQQDIMWIHPASVEINKESPLFLISIVASGAVASPVAAIRKLGFALQEALRESHPRQFEKDNRWTRDLRTLQSFALSLDVGLWSGDRRKMEICESFAMPLLTMVRRAGHYRHQVATEFPPLESDEGPQLESKWRSWIRQESFKRLALYLFYRDTRSSMSLLTQPLVSYAEVATAVPCHRSIWLAKTASEWKQAYIARCRNGAIQPPSIQSCIDDSTPIFEHQEVIDVDLTLLLVNAAVWPLIWQFREMKNAAKFRRARDLRQGVTTMNSRLHEVTQLLGHIKLSASEWVGDMEPAAWLLQEQCLMHLYVSLEDVQTLAGREGEEEAQRVFPTLTAWVESTESRRALFHAGQVVRVARMYPKAPFRDATAVAVYHASLVFWAYSILSRKQGNGPSSRVLSPNPPSGSLKLVRLDSEDTLEVQRFVTFGKGMPCIGQHLEKEEIDMSKVVSLKDTAEIMAVITRLLETPYEGEAGSCPPLLENLSKLVESLGKAARRTS